MKAIVCVGIPGSGKSTFANELCDKEDGDIWIEINRDDVRFSVFNNDVRDWTKYKFTNKNETLVTNIINEKIDTLAKDKFNIICSDTNLNPKYRHAMISKLEGYGYEVEVKVFHCTLEEAWKRDANREGGVGKDVIYTMYQKYLNYIGRKTYTPDENKQDCIICDIDGTIARMHNRKPFEWHKVGQDLPRKEIIFMLNSYAIDYDCEIIYLSGRDSACRKETEEWLYKHVVELDDFSKDLFMRAEKDNRKDSIIKEELFWEHVEPYYNVKMVVDDRPCMIRLWYELGIPNVISVADPWLEF